VETTGVWGAQVPANQARDHHNGGRWPGRAEPWAQHPVAVVDYCHTLQAADWDLDGDVELLVGGMTQPRDRGLKLLLDAGAGTSWTEFVLQTPAPRCRRARVSASGRR